MIVENLNNPINHLGEGPVWNIAEQQFYWVDILNGEIWRINKKTTQPELFWKGDHEIGGFAFNKENDIVFFSEKGVFKLRKGERTPEKLLEPPFGSGERFNDITTDPAGRIYAGTKEDSLKNSKLFLIEKGSEPFMLLDSLGISNGMAFSMNEKYFYHIDSIPCKITRYEYEPCTGEIHSPVVIYQGNEASGFPDGLTIDTKDYLWAAFWGASCIRRLKPDGQVDQEIKLPAIQISSLTFAGNNLDELYVTSACEGGKDIVNGRNEKGEFLGGTVFHLKTGFKGRMDWPANL